MTPRERATLQDHYIRSEMVRSRLAQEPLTADEIARGVPLAHNEYLALVELTLNLARRTASPTTEGE